MKLKLITDNDRVHAIVTEQGDIVTGVTDVQMRFGREAGRAGRSATLVLTGLEVVVVPTNEVPRVQGGPYS